MIHTLTFICMRLSLCVCFSLLILFYHFIYAIRTACVIAVAKARDTFEPFLHQVTINFSLVFFHNYLSFIYLFLNLFSRPYVMFFFKKAKICVSFVQLGSRLLHILKRLLPISVYLLQV